MKTSKLTKLVVAVVAMTVLTMPGGPALGAEWTPDKSPSRKRSTTCV